MASPFDWSTLLNNTVAPMGGKILGDQIAPDPSLINAQQNGQNGQVTNALNVAKFNKSSKAQALALPGMLKTLGYSPESADAAGASFGAPVTPGQNGFPTLGAPGASAGKTAAGAAMSFGAPIVSGLLKKAAPAVAGLGAAPSMAGIASGITASAVPDIGAGIEAAGGLGAAGAGEAAAAAGGAAGGAGIMGTLGALATNPLTWAAAGAIGAGLLWKKSQAHPTADQWVQGEQNPFDKTMSNIDTQVQGGSMTPDEAKQLKAKNAQTYLSELQQFSTQGGHQAVVAKQAADTFRQYYGDPAQYGIKLSF